ncbi:PIN domain-containing protein [Bacteroidetes/Chlorobi group bacterium ChocPot_Mid]|nr:MAG: PIN domain-containing protein [Bacteroidetes/Chlorobi group bacterium ChocPot_Mid]
MKKQKVYIETSVISYLTSKPSRDLIIAGHQQITLEWWKKVKNKFDCYISQIVIEEISKGDAIASTARIKAVQDMPILAYSTEIEDLAKKYVELLNIPEKSKLDAFHLAFAVMFKIDFLLSWNCKHIANAMINLKIKNFNNKSARYVPFLCTPQELLEV